MLKYIVILGALVNLVGVFIYIVSTLKWNTKPNKVSWLIRAISPLIASGAALSDGVHWAVLPVFMSGFGTLLVFIASFVNRKAYWRLEKFDYICGVCSVLALVLRWITKQPTIAIIFSIISSWFATVPTIIKSRKHPHTESAAPYIAWLFSAATSVFAMETFGFSEVAFPLYIVIANGLLIATIFRGKLKK